MDQQEVTEVNSKETRGRKGPIVRLSLDLPMSDFQTAHALVGKRIRHLGEVITIERVFIEALQSYAKSLSSQD